MVATSWIKYNVTNRKKGQGFALHFHNIQSGIPQGSHLEPLLLTSTITISAVAMIVCNYKR